MTATGLAQLFSHMNYLWGDPIDKDPVLAAHWFRALEVVEDDVMLEALPILAQQIDRRPTIAQLVAQARLVAASRRSVPALPEARHISAYTQAWMKILRAWREGRLEPTAFLPVSARHDAYFRSGNSSATPAMVDESEALLAQVKPGAAA